MEALEKLKIKLGIEVTDTSKDTILNMYLEDAESTVLMFLNMEALEGAFLSTKINIAKLMYQKDNSITDSAVKSESHSEGVVSESYTYKSDAEYEADIDGELEKIKRYRRVKVKNSGDKQET